MSSARETPRQKAGPSDNAQSSPPRRLTRDTQFIVTSVFVVGGLVLGQAYLLSARFDDVNQRIDDVNERFDDVNQRFDDVNQRFDDIDQRFDDVNQRIDALEERVNKRIDELQDDVREIRSIVLRYLAERNQGTVGGTEAAKPLGNSAPTGDRQPSTPIR